MPRSNYRRRLAPLATALAFASSAALTTAAAQAQTPETQVWIDVSTHTSGMPDMGAMAGLAGRMAGGTSNDMRYPTARGNAGFGTSGLFLDVALYNKLKPGVEAQLAIPDGLKLGTSLLLTPPPPARETTPQTKGGTQKLPDIEVTILEYWGCGDKVRAGQPTKFKMKMSGGAMQTSGSMSPGKFVPDRDVDATPAYAVWPNKKDGRRVPNGALLAGSHRFSGNGVPESLKFDLGRNAEFMPKIALSAQGEATDAIKLNWQRVDRARAYFINAFAMQSQNTIVLWSSAETAGAGHGLQQYLTGSYIDRWLKEKVLLPTSTTSCTIPKGIFSAPNGSDPESGMAGMSMLTMIAYGPETHVVWPPKPADAEELKKWKPEWNVRIRTKSTAGAMLGMDMGGMDMGADAASDADTTDEEPAQEEGQKESKGKKFLKGILKKF